MNATDETVAFLRAVAESDADDAPRLVFADWLEEHGRGARAEFIRIQCELHRPEGVTARCGQTASRQDRLCKDPTCRWCVLRRRERQLFRRHKAEWFAAYVAAAGPASLPVVRRGFVEGLGVPARQFLAHARAVFREQPVRYVRLTDRKPARLRRSPDLVEFRWLGGPDPGGRSPEYASPWFVPAEVVAHAEPAEFSRTFPSEREALDALSRWCVAYGRSLASYG